MFGGLTFPWQTLLDWYSSHGRHTLPWRDYNYDQKNLDYRIWISEIFLQQTQVDRVIGYFDTIIAKFPTIEVLANTDYETFFAYYRGLGYYSRAKNILKTAAILTNTNDGIFPKTLSELRELPGIGEYSARAILAFGSGKPYLAWDTNLDKIFSRYFFGTRERHITSEEKASLEEDFVSFISTKSGENLQKNTVRAINNALMDFAAIIDLKNSTLIDWDHYPIKNGIWYETRGSLENIAEKKKHIFPIPDARMMIILHQDHKIYFSPSKKGYVPFILSPALHRDIRAYIQEYFREHYGLELSVRPIQKKWFSKTGEPWIAVNAQIQIGQSRFSEYSRSDYQEWKKSQDI